MVEVWRPIEGYEGLYEVSNLGRVKSLARRVELRNYNRSRKINERILKFSKHKRGYLVVAIAGKNRLVHRLVAEAFLSNPNGKPEVNHLDGNKSNNNVKNLEWVTSSENKKHAYVQGLNVPPKPKRGSRNPHAKLSELDVEYIRSHVKLYDKVYGQSALARQFNVSEPTIHAIVNHKKWRHDDASIL